MSGSLLDAGQSLDRKKLSEQLYEILERKVMDGELSPGTRLSEESIAEAFNVSRSPAREALIDLEKAGLAVRAGARDRIVAIPTREMILEKYDLWWIIDAGRTYLSSLNATQKDCDELREAVDRMGRAVAARDKKRYQAACDNWHAKLHQSCLNTFVNKVGSDIDLYLRWIEIPYNNAPDMSKEVVDEHRDILDAYEKRDLGALTKAIQRHATRQRDYVLALFESGAGRSTSNPPQGLGQTRAN